MLLMAALLSTSGVEVWLSGSPQVWNGRDSGVDYLWQTLKEPFYNARSKLWGFRVATVCKDLKEPISDSRLS